MSKSNAWFSRKWTEYKKNFDLLDSVLLIAFLSYIWIICELSFTSWAIALLLLFIWEFLSNNTSQSKVPWRSKPIPRYHWSFYLILLFCLLCWQHRLFTALYLLLALYFIIMLIIVRHENKLKNIWRKERDAKLANILDEYKSSLGQPPPPDNSGNPEEPNSKYT
jgi:hypothetical protein